MEEIDLYRGVSDNRNPLHLKDTVGGLFFSPDKNIALEYSGDFGKIIHIKAKFNNLLRSDNWLIAKKMVGLEINASMSNLIDKAKKLKYDGISFKSINGIEYIIFPNITKFKIIKDNVLKENKISLKKIVDELLYKEHIIKRGSSYIVTNKSKSKVLGTHKTKKSAQKQLAAIEINKSKRV